MSQLARRSSAAKRPVNGSHAHNKVLRLTVNQVLHRAVQTSYTNAFTVDVEDYFHVQAMAKTVQRHEWDEYELRVVPNTHRILRLLRRHEVQATFFVLGWVANRCPQLVRDIRDDGHEIGSHSYWHRLIYEMTPEEFAADLHRSCDVLSEIIGESVESYRAPCFSITQRSLWAIDILLEQGIRFDSSIYPVRHDVYGLPNARRHPHLLQGANGQSLLEFPPAVRRYCGFNLPVAGGGYFRLFPANLSIRWLRAVNQKESQPFAFYIHPWEIDPDQPRLKTSMKSRLRHYQNLKSCESKLERLLQEFSFGTLSSAINKKGQADASARPTSSCAGSASPGEAHVG